MLSNNQKKLVRSLQQKKYRVKHRLFTLEGDKIVGDLIKTNSINDKNIQFLAATENWIRKNQPVLTHIGINCIDSFAKDLKSLSSLITPPEVIAVVKIPDLTFDYQMLRNDYTLILDQIRDPGNLGTIIRTAAWFGINQIICSNNSVDQYNNKAIQASMGAVMTVPVYYLPLEKLLQHANHVKIPVYATALDGCNLFEAKLSSPGLILFGNEAHGLSENLFKYITESIKIPGSVDLLTNQHDTESKSNNSIIGGVESLNVASAVASVLTECQRRNITQNEN